MINHINNNKIIIKNSIFFYFTNFKFIYYSKKNMKCELKFISPSIDFFLPASLTIERKAIVLRAIFFARQFLRAQK